MDKKLQLDTAAFVLLLVAFPVISLGSSHGHTAVWIIGLVAMILAGMLPITTRYMSHLSDRLRDTGPEFDERVS